jgi:DNA-binding MarR family transcriptional regulator
MPGASPPATPVPADAFAAAWDELLLAVRRAQARGQQAGDGVSLAQYYFALPLLDGAAVPVCRLAELAGVAAPTATRLLDGLERSGLLLRERSQRDRRSVLVTLTPDGRRRLLAKRRQLAARRRRLYERLDPEERGQSERLLRHLAELIEQL